MRFRYITKEKVKDIPNTSGVYAFRDNTEVIYIGKAARLRTRIQNHFSQPSYRDNLFMKRVEKIGYLQTNSEIEALLLESQLIKQRTPRYNVMWKDDKNYFYVAVTKEKLPRIFLTHQPTSHETRSMKHQTKKKKMLHILGSATEASTVASRAIPTAPPELRTAGRSLRQDVEYIGPFVEGKAIKRVLKLLRKVFPYYTGKTHPRRACQYCNLQLCPGAEPDITSYRRDIKNLTAVLKGKRTSVLRLLRKEMGEASKIHEFEKAGRLRDQIEDLEMIIAHSKIFSPSHTRTPLNWRETQRVLQKVLKTKKRISRVEAYDISNIQGKESTGSMVVFQDGRAAKNQYRKFKIKITGKANDVAMMKELVSRRLKHKEWKYPDLMIIDGGKGQLSSSVKAMTREQKARIQVAAIAKRNNELFMPGAREPVLLKNLPDGISNLILHIRDEAHRFAITYHRKLRKRELFAKSDEG